MRLHMPGVVLLLWPIGALQDLHKHRYNPQTFAFCRFLTRTLTFLRAICSEMPWLMAMETSILIFIYRFARYSRSFGCRAFVKLFTLKFTSFGKSSFSSSEPILTPGPTITSISSRSTSSGSGEASAASASWAGDVWLVRLSDWLAIYIHAIQSVCQPIYPI